MRKLMWFACLAAALSACAVIEPPSGGPEDKSPPKIMAFVPSEDSSGVARDTRVSIEFSEKIDGESFKNRIATYPPLEFREIRSRGNILELEFREELPETTICIVVKGGFRDQHLVVNRKSYQLLFSTTDRIDTGTISGKILFKQKPDSSGVAMLIKLTAGDTIGEFFSEDEARIAVSDGFGNYRFRGLPVDGTRFIVWSFIDSDQDGRFSFGKEFFTGYPDTVSLSMNETARKGIDMNIIDPDEPGSVEGVVRDITGLEQPTLLRLERAHGSKAYYATLADTLGVFRFPSVAPGDYVLIAFKDINADSLAGEYTLPEDSTAVLLEPFIILPDTLRLLPDEDRMLEPFEISGKE